MFTWFKKLFCRHKNLVLRIAIEEIIEVGLGGLEPFESYKCMECGRHVYVDSFSGITPLKIEYYAKTNVFKDDPYTVSFDKIKSLSYLNIDAEEYQWLVNWLKKKHPDVKIE